MISQLLGGPIMDLGLHLVQVFVPLFANMSLSFDEQVVFCDEFVRTADHTRIVAGVSVLDREVVHLQVAQDEVAAQNRERLLWQHFELLECQVTNRSRFVALRLRFRVVLLPSEECFSFFDHIVLPQFADEIFGEVEVVEVFVKLLRRYELVFEDLLEGSYSLGWMRKVYRTTGTASSALADNPGSVSSTSSARPTLCQGNGP